MITFEEFNGAFPDEDSCLEYMAKLRFKGCPKCQRPLYRVRGRKCFVCPNGHHSYPLADTILRGSSTPLRSWFFAFYLANNSKNGVSAKELERHLGVTYKTAWRIASVIRKLMSQNTRPLEGVVEMDEMYWGGKRGYKKGIPKTPIIGAVERGGEARAIALPGVRAIKKEDIYDFILSEISPKATIMTDEFKGYHYLSEICKEHFTINHSDKFVEGPVYTNTIEGLWSLIKRGLHGTHHSVSRKHLQSYVDFYVWQYNHRDEPFDSLVSCLLPCESAQKFSLCRS